MAMNTNPDIGIVCGGGGMTCAYSAGALEAILKHHGFATPKVLIGGCGGSGNCAYYAAGQSDVGRHIWTNLLTDGQMISWRRWPVLDLDYLVNKVFRKQVPLNVGKIKTNKHTHFFIPASNTKTGCLRYFSNHDRDIDVFNVLIAAKTIPLVAGKFHCVQDNCKYSFADGDLAGQLHHHTRLAEDYGCEKIIVIDNQSSYGPGMFLAIHGYFLFAGKALKRALRRGFHDDHATITDTEHIITLRPSQPLKMGALTDKRAKIERAYDMGYQDAVNHPRLKELFT